MLIKDGQYHYEEFGVERLNGGIFVATYRIYKGDITISTTSSIRYARMICDALNNQDKRNSTLTKTQAPK